MSHGSRRRDDADDEHPWTSHDPDERHDVRSRPDDERVTRRSRIEHRPNRDRRGRWPSAVVALVGLWLVLEAVVLAVPPARATNALLVGGILALSGGYNYYRRSNAVLGSVGLAAFAAILGLWLAISPFVLAPTPGADGDGAVAMVTDVLLGLAAFVAAGYSAYAARDRRLAADARDTATYDRRGH